MRRGWLTSAGKRSISRGWRRRLPGYRQAAASAERRCLLPTTEIAVSNTVVFAKAVSVGLLALNSSTGNDALLAIRRHLRPKDRGLTQSDLPFLCLGAIIVILSTAVGRREGGSLGAVRRFKYPSAATRKKPVGARSDSRPWDSPPSPIRRKRSSHGRG